MIAAIWLVVVGACGNASRPSAAEWIPRWETIVASLPPLESIGTPPSEELCQETLGVLRTDQGHLIPSPDPAIDDVVQQWVQVAENAFFECPPSSEDVPDMAAAYDELSRLEAEVNVALIDRPE